MPVRLRVIFLLARPLESSSGGSAKHPDLLPRILRHLHSLAALRSGASESQMFQSCQSSFHWLPPHGVSMVCSLSSSWIMLHQLSKVFNLFPCMNCQTGFDLSSVTHYSTLSSQNVLQLPSDRMTTSWSQHQQAGGKRQFWRWRSAA